MPKAGYKEKQWNKDKMINAINAIREKKMDYHLASNTFDVPIATLYYTLFFFIINKNLQSKIRVGTLISYPNFQLV